MNETTESGPYRWRPSNYACPECGERMEAKTGPDGITVERCSYCEWSKVFDPAADEFPTQELDRISRQNHADSARSGGANSDE